MLGRWKRQFFHALTPECLATGDQREKDGATNNRFDHFEDIPFDRLVMAMRQQTTVVSSRNEPPSFGQISYYPSTSVEFRPSNHFV